MTAFSILSALLSLFGKLTEYAHDKQLIDAGQAKAIADMHAKAAERVTKALEAREAMAADLRANPDRVHERDENWRPD